MKTLMIITLIVLGMLWVFFASAFPMAMRVGATSDAMQLERDLNVWATEKVAEGKLSESDVEEIFTEGYSLILGGERKDRNFREMIGHIAVSSAPPAWPGLVMILIGLLGAIHSIYLAFKNKRPAEQGGDGDTEGSV